MRKKHASIAIAGVSAILLVVLSNPVLSDSPEFGRIPDEAFVEGADLNGDLVPDFVEYVGQGDEVVGYVAKGDIISIDGGEPPEGPIPVVDRDLNLVGHHVPGLGFVPFGTDPAKIDPVTSTTIVYD